MPDTSLPGPEDPASPRCQDPVPLIPTTGLAGRRLAVRKPLPDAQAIVSIAVPEIAPPFDDAVAGRPVRRAAPRRLASVPAVSGGPAGVPPVDGGQSRSGWPARPATLTPATLTGEAGRPASRPAGTDGPDGTGLPGGGGWPSQFAQVLAETLAGSRPPAQIVPWTTEQARRRISQLGPTLATAHSPRVRRVIVTSPASGVLEMTIVLTAGPQARAVAVRLERADSRPGRRPAEEAVIRPYRPRKRPQSPWLCTAIEAA